MAEQPPEPVVAEATEAERPVRKMRPWGGIVNIQDAPADFRERYERSIQRDT